MREIVVEGTSFNPNTGGVVGVKALDRNLEVNHTVKPLAILSKLSKHFPQYSTCQQSRLIAH